MKLILAFFMTFYIVVKEMTAFIIGNITKVIGAVLASLKSHPGEQVGVRAEPQSCSNDLVMCLGIIFLKLVSEILLHLILFWQWVRYEILCCVSRILLLRFTSTYYVAEFYNRQIKEVDSNIQPRLKEIFRKFDECKNCTTLTIQMRNGIKNITVANAVKTAVEYYVVNETSNETSRLKILRFISTAQQLIISLKNTFA